VPSSPSKRWIANQPYLLLSITAACWAGNAIVGKLAAGHIAPVTLSFLRWSLAFLIILPFAWKHLVRDWAAIRGKLGIMILLSVTGIGAFNTMQYWSLEHTQAINTLLLQPALPLFVAMWSLVLVGARLTLGAGGRHPAVADRRARHHAAWRPDNPEGRRFQTAATSSSCSRCSSSALFRADGAATALHSLSFVGFTFGCGAACLIPLFILELHTRPFMTIDAANVLSLLYDAVFPLHDRLSLLQPRRAADRPEPRRARSFISCRRSAR
jgi:drug/metabolite transporter (DMT)-like permease